MCHLNFILDILKTFVYQMKPWQTSLNKTPTKWGKKGTKEDDPSLS
jgi:hypothetical protein